MFAYSYLKLGDELWYLNSKESPVFVEKHLEIVNFASGLRILPMHVGKYKLSCYLITVVEIDTNFI